METQRPTPVAHLIAYDSRMRPLDAKRNAEEITAEVYGLTTQGCAWVHVQPVKPASVPYRVKVPQ